jgi:hypothetical protein
MPIRKLNQEEEKFRQLLFTKWTAGLSQVEQRVSIFSHIRDIPYAIVPEWRGADSDVIRLMVSENRGWCGPKHTLLMWMFEQLGTVVEPLYIPFRWQEQPVEYPHLLKKYLPYLSDTLHLCCRAYLNEKWQVIDATWDPPLKRVGFPVNDPWDGLSGTTPAVTTINPAQEKKTIPLSHAVRVHGGEFISNLNFWMEDVRSQKKR